MSASPGSVTQARVCTYCLGAFEGRADADTCSTACRQAKSRALRTDYVEPASSDRRRTTYSPERAAATGFGTLTGREQYEADLRVRAAAGLE